ncbi:MAG: transcription-repair coupling factor [Clostridia bacterium]|jgi:transcription-repair coupling factor (superfamily II helicase)
MYVPFDQILNRSSVFQEILSSLKAEKGLCSVTGLIDSQKVHFSACLLHRMNLKGLYVTYNEFEAKKAYEDFSFFFKDRVLHLPYREVMLYDIEAGSRDTAYTRLDVLSKVLAGEYDVLVLSVDSFVRKLCPAEIFKSRILELKAFDTADLDRLTETLVTMGYKRVDTVYKKGEFAVRGGILDIFSVNYENALRIEFFDDEIDSIRFFDPETQRSVEAVEKIKIIPAEEIQMDRERLPEIFENIRRALSQVKSDFVNMEKLREKTERDIEKLANQLYVPGLDRYAEFINDSPVSIFDYISEPVLLFADDYKKCAERMEIIQKEHSETVTALMEDGYLLPQCQNGLFSMEHFNEFLFSFPKSVYYAPFTPAKEIRYTALYGINAKGVDLYERRIDFLIKDLREMLKDRYSVIIAAGSERRILSLSKILSDEGIGTVLQEQDIREIVPGRVYLCDGILNRGFEYVDEKWVVIALKDRISQRARSKKTKKRMDLFTDLKPGDYVVHDIHGVGRYVGVEQLVIENVKKDYLKIEYKGGDVLYLPVNQMDLIQKYIGQEGSAPKVHSLGGKEWIRTKSRVKESLREIAQELVKLYAKRQTMIGHAFSKDTVWQAQFEEAFPHIETEDQIKCVQEIKKDMENSQVMDRLLCGDVGYGKTEVALRAMFKAVMDGKQVAYLVPTTVLARQHFENFTARFEGFPIKVEMLSRFRTKAQQAKIIKDLEKGLVDVVVGTHRLLSQDVKFKDLGLLVIDEEQRFGVEHKEKVKKDFAGVDVLTLTATPIPRTLHMSLTGIRDISVIEDPPEERHPVRTYVLEYDEQVIKDAVYREIARGGQVFYLYNRVKGIEGKQKKLLDMLPGVKVGVAHGQMSERKLEDQMNAFLKGEFDVLLCTTIIESGLDMPNVNTLIVENADKMGLAQLYQLRGRVGRSNRIAYAYITYKKDMTLSPIAEKRLEAIREFTDFGSGFKIAMRDMELRGVGNLLGYEQHGHIDVVGYDTYVRLLDEAIREVKGEKKEETVNETAVDINVNAYIDKEYIENESTRIELYKRIVALGSKEEAEDIVDELIDRFGDVPEETHNLIRIALLRKMANDIKIKSIERKSRQMVITFGDMNPDVFRRMGKLTVPFKGRFLFDAGVKPSLVLKMQDKNEKVILDELENLIRLLHDD